MEEQWKDIPCYEGLYQASNFGRIKSLARISERSRGGIKYVQNRPEKILKAAKSSNKYLNVQLSNKSFMVHRLIALCFCKQKKYSEFVNHIDGNKLNNYASNLEWCNRQENIDHGYVNGLMRKSQGSNHHKAILTEKDIPIIRGLFKYIGVRQVDLAAMFDVNRVNIKHVTSYKLWKNI